MKLDELIDIKQHHRYGKYSLKKMKQLVTNAARIATLTRARAMKAIKDANMPLPNAYRDFPESEKSRGIKSWRNVNFYATKTDLSGSEEQQKAKLRSKFSMIMGFLSDTTKTKKGWEKTVDKFVDRMINKAGLNKEEIIKFKKVFNDKEKHNMLFKVYNRLQEAQADREITGSSDVMIAQIASAAPNFSDADDLTAFFIDKYEKIQDEMNAQYLEETPEGVDILADVVRKKLSVKSL